MGPVLFLRAGQSFLVVMNKASDLKKQARLLVKISKFGEQLLLFEFPQNRELILSYAMASQVFANIGEDFEDCDLREETRRVAFLVKSHRLDLVGPLLDLRKERGALLSFRALQFLQSFFLEGGSCFPHFG